MSALRMLCLIQTPGLPAAFVMALCGSKVSMSSAFHSKSDGQTERVNRTLEQAQRMFVSPAQDD